MASIHDKLKRVRKPRVHITYDVETGGAQVDRELPFVVGVLGDFSGNPEQPLRSLKERKFVQIDRDNFDEIMSKTAPELNFKVENTITDDGTEMAVQLKFKSMDDFEPAKIVEQVAPLKKLMETRGKLNDLMAKVDRSEDLEGILEQVLQNSDDLRKLQSELGVDEGGAETGDDPPQAADDTPPAGTPQAGDDQPDAGDDEPQEGGQ